MPKTRRSFPLVILGLILAWAIATFLVWPNVNLLVETFFPNGQFSSAAVEKLVSSDRAMKALRNSFVLAVSLAITSNLVGIFIVLVTKYFKLRGSRFLWLSYATTFIYGGVVLAAGYKFVYGSGGLLTNAARSVFDGISPDWFQGYGAVLFTMTLATTTNHLLFVSSALDRVDFQTIEAARMMGANQWYILRRIVLPTIAPVLFAVTILSFLTGLGALSAPIVLGGRDFQTITPIILTFSRSGSSRDIAALLALILGIVTIALLTLFNWVEKKGVYFSTSKAATKLVKQEVENPVARVVVHAIAYVLAVLYLLPISLIILFSFMDKTAINTGKLSVASLSFENYTRVLSSGNALRPFLVSVTYSALAAIVVAALMLLASQLITKYRNRWTAAMEYLLHIPWILPSTMIALGLIMSYDHANPLTAGIVLTGTPVILLIGYVIVKIPFTLRLLKSAFSTLNKSYEEAAQLMGANPLYIFRRITFPAVLPAVAAVTALNFNSLLDDYDMSVFLAHPLYQPVGPIIQANTSGNVGPEAQANNFVYTVLLMLIAGTTMYLVYGRGSNQKKVKRAARKATGKTGPDV